MQVFSEVTVTEKSAESVSPGMSSIPSVLAQQSAYSFTVATQSKKFLPDVQHQNTSLTPSTVEKSRFPIVTLTE